MNLRAQFENAIDESIDTRVSSWCTPHLKRYHLIFHKQDANAYRQRGDQALGRLITSVLQEDYPQYPDEFHTLARQTLTTSPTLAALIQQAKIFCPFQVSEMTTRTRADLFVLFVGISDEEQTLRNMVTWTRETFGVIIDDLVRVYDASRFHDISAFREKRKRSESADAYYLESPSMKRSKQYRDRPAGVSRPTGYCSADSNAQDDNRYLALEMQFTPAASNPQPPKHALDEVQDVHVRRHAPAVTTRPSTGSENEQQYVDRRGRPNLQQGSTSSQQSLGDKITRRREPQDRLRPFSLLSNRLYQKSLPPQDQVITSRPLNYNHVFEYRKNRNGAGAPGRPSPSAFSLTPYPTMRKAVAKGVSLGETESLIDEPQSRTEPYLSSP
ncbi:hypothetical protein Hypma_009414 [Hypsizygus marmoreus]|uniref:Uncharacterized protein n=1 Tax=Hypsizygus marmoreus TaxID=39966 RepID=A0A369JMB6_HYPMA|nr:hypothetical protein Hypma_009414 [Hypsizygus marmoreus]